MCREGNFSIFAALRPALPIVQHYDRIMLLLIHTARPRSAIWWSKWRETVQVRYRFPFDLLSKTRFEQFSSELLSFNRL